MNIEQFLYEHPVFRLDELAKWKVGHGAYNKKAIHALIQHYLKSGRLLRIRRELYAVIPPNMTPDDLSVDPYIIASKASQDSVLGFHTALELFGVAYSAFNQFMYITTKKIKPFIFHEQRFQPVALPVSLKSNNTAFEVDKINRQGVDILVTTLPRTFVDVLSRVDLSGGWEEVVRSINNISSLDIDKTIEYCIRLNNSVLSAKVGYFLEKLQGVFAPTSKQISKLLDKKPSSPQYLSKKNQKNCKLIKRWNIMMPTSVIEENWEEPEHDI